MAGRPHEEPLIDENENLIDVEAVFDDHDNERDAIREILRRMGVDDEEYIEQAVESIEDMTAPTREDGGKD